MNHTPAAQKATPLAVSRIGKLSTHHSLRSLAAPAAAGILSVLASTAGATTFTVTSTADDGSAGTLRGAIISANGTAGPHTINFNIPGVAAGSPAIIQITGGLLPAITATSVTLDGTTQPDTNTGDITGGQVLGVGPDGIPGSGDEPLLAPIPKPDVVIEYVSAAGAISQGILTVSAPNAVIRGVGLRRGAGASLVSGLILNSSASNTQLSKIWLGSSQGALTDLSDDPNLGLGNGVWNRVPGSLKMEQSVVASSRVFGVIGTGTGVGGAHSLTANYFGSAGLTSSATNSEPVNFTAEGPHVVSGNYFKSPNYSGGIDAIAGQATISGNTFYRTYGSNATPAFYDEAAAITLRGGVHDSLIVNNLIEDTGFGNGILVQSANYNGVSLRNVISRNSIFGSGKLNPPTGPGGDVQSLGINLNASLALDATKPSNPDGVTPNSGVLDPQSGNQGMNYPVLTRAVLNGSQLTVKGFVGTTTSSAPFAGSTVELFAADNSPANQNGPVFVGGGLPVPHGEGRVYLGTVTADGTGAFEGSITVPPAALAAWQAFVGHTPTTGDPITSTATLAAAGTSEFGANLALVIVQAVTESATVMAGVGNPNALPNIRSNDAIDGAPATAANSTIAIVGTWPAGITLNPVTGTVGVAPSVPVGVYPITYQLCDLTTPVANCVTTEDYITVSGAGGMTSVPTLSQWAIALLSMLLGGAGWLAVRRRDS